MNGFVKVIQSVQQVDCSRMVFAYFPSRRPESGISRMNVTSKEKQRAFFSDASGAKMPRFFKRKMFVIPRHGAFQSYSPRQVFYPEKKSPTNPNGNTLENGKNKRRRAAVLLGTQSINVGRLRIEFWPRWHCHEQAAFVSSDAVTTGSGNDGSLACFDRS